MEKVSISRFTEKIIEQHGSDNAEAVLIIAVDGEHVTTSCIGPDPMFINDTTPSKTPSVSEASQFEKEESR